MKRLLSIPLHIPDVNRVMLPVFVKTLDEFYGEDSGFKSTKSNERKTFSDCVLVLTGVEETKRAGTFFCTCFFRRQNEKRTKQIFERKNNKTVKIANKR